jgi:hypothetical protein
MVSIKTAILFSIITLTLVIPSIARAQQTGNELLMGCEFAMAAIEERRKNMTESGAYCGGYIRGVMDMVYLMNQGYRDAGLPNAPGNICIPDKATNGQVIRTVTKIMRDTPEKLHEPEIVLVLLALKKGFPCTDK